MVKHFFLLFYFTVGMTAMNPEARAQVHYLQFDATPIAVNPAFAGMFDGRLRVSSLYRNQWASVTVPFVTYGFSFDLPVWKCESHSFLGLGAQVFQDIAGDGNLRNFSGILSFAYNKRFGNRDGRFCYLGVGLSGVAGNRSGDLNKPFYGEYFNQDPNGPVLLGVGSSYTFYDLNVGLSFSQYLGQKFIYTIGVTENNITTPQDKDASGLLRRMGVTRNTTTVFSAEWLLNKFKLRPALYIMSVESNNRIIIGAEIGYGIGPKSEYRFPLTLCLGSFYRSNDILSFSAGAEFRKFRVGFAYDTKCAIAGFSNADQGAIELAVRYITPSNLWKNKSLAPVRH